MVLGVFCTTVSLCCTRRLTHAHPTSSLLQENPSCTSFRVNWESRFTGRVILDDTAGDLPVVDVKVSFTVGRGSNVITGTRTTDEDGYFTIHIVVCWSMTLSKNVC